MNPCLKTLQGELQIIVRHQLMKSADKKHTNKLSIIKLLIQASMHVDLPKTTGTQLMDNAVNIS